MLPEEDAEAVNMAPSPTNKLRCFVTMLFGRGGFGKSTLLRHYRSIASSKQYHYTVCEIIDWEFAIDGRRGIFQPGQQQHIEPLAYYHVLCEQLAATLHKQPRDFKEYQTAVSAVEQAHKEARHALEGLRTDDRYKWLRDLSVEGINTALRASVPGSGVVLEVPEVKKAEDAAAKLTQEQLGQLITHLRTKLKQRTDDFLAPDLRLGFALGRDLARFARKAPILFLFDTYEEIDEGDSLLRIVMAAASLRVGWVIAGRDNLWGGLDQRERSLALEYGYKDLVSSDRGLAINFNAQDIGTFSLGDILHYFQQLTQLAQQEQVLSTLTETEAKRVLDVTQGIPLAVNIAAELYRDTGTLVVVTEKGEGKREIIDRMVRRYLLHARDEQQQRAQLYGLALLRRADQPHAVTAALGLTPDQAQQHYQHTLTQLHRRYSFIFTEKAVPTLHQEVRHFLRLWLLEHCIQPEIAVINERISTAQEEALHHLEKLRHYGSLEERLQDDEWVNTYLDLAEQVYWRDPISGIQTILPFMLAAAIYRPAANKDAAQIGDFFMLRLRQPYRTWWQWASAGLPGATTSVNTNERRQGLLALNRLAEQRCLSFSSPLPGFRKELEAAIWWNLGDVYSNEENNKAVAWYERALARLEQHTTLRKDAARVYFEIAYTLDDEKRYAEAIVHLTKAIALDPNDAFAYNNRGYAYYSLKNYQQAIADFDQAITLDHNDAMIYINRGIAYDDLEDYQQAIVDYDQAIALDPNNTAVYNCRGLAYRNLKNYLQAIADYDRAIALDPNYALAYNNRGNAYSNLEDYQQAIADYDRAIALDPNKAFAYTNRGYAYGFLKNYQQAIADYDQATALDPNDAFTYTNRGCAYSNLEDYQQAIADYDRAIALDPNDALAYHDRGLAYGNLEDYQQAITDFDRAIALDLNSATAYSNRGYASLFLKDDQQAIADFRHVYKLDQGNLNAVWMVTWIGMGKKQPNAEIMECLEEIAKSKTQNDLQQSSVSICKGLLLGWHGKLKEGLVRLEQAIVLYPESEDAYFWKGLLDAYYYHGEHHDQEAHEAIEQALQNGMPPILLRPLYWLERDKPEFFIRYARPLLEKHSV